LILAVFGYWNIGHWNLFGIWNLGFGILVKSPMARMLKTLWGAQFKLSNGESNKEVDDARKNIGLF
jgi:hypothetical protein